MCTIDGLRGVDEPGCDSLQITFQEVEAFDTCLVLTLRGELDTYSAPFFQRSAQKAIDAGFIHLVLILDSVDYVSSKAVGALIQVQQQARNGGGDIAMARVQPRVRDVFRLLSLESFFRCASSLEKAIDLVRDAKLTPS